MDIYNSLFHIVKSRYGYFNSINTLESIMKDGYILTRTHLKNKGFNFANPCSYQGDNAISVCFHPDNKGLYELFKNSYTQFREDSAYNLFINEFTPVIILNKQLLNDLTIQNDSHLRMKDEIQVMNDIPLTYMTGIGVKDNLTKYFISINNWRQNKYDENDIINIRDFELQLHLYKNNLDKLLLDKFSLINNLEILKNEYHYDVQIVDINNGLPIYSRKEEIKDGIQYIKKNHPTFQVR